jgi:hypothetical protein
MSTKVVIKRKITILDVKRDYARAQFKKLRAKATVNGRKCVIPKRQPRVDGYVRWTIPPGAVAEAFSDLAADERPQGEQSFYTHQLAYYAEHGTIPKRNEMHLSHLCGDARCMNPDHLVVETPEENNSRKNCPVQVECTHCHQITPACNHTHRSVFRILRASNLGFPSKNWTIS